jgi:hypothetical protein
LPALPLMRRTALMAVALAVLVTAGALNAQTSQSTKTPRRIGAAATSRATHRPLHSAGRPDARERSYQNSNGRLSSTRTSIRTRLTPDEAGREAGLAILRRREGAQVPRRRMVRVVRRYSMRRVRLERAAWRSDESGATRTDESSDAADRYSVPEAGQADTDETQSMELRRKDGARDAMPATSPTESEDSADAGRALVERMDRDGTTAGEAATEQDRDETSAAASNQSGEVADSGVAKRAGDEASLVIPRSGMPAPLRGSLASLERQNDRLEAEGLERIEDEADLAARIADKLLVPIPISSALTVNPDLEENHRYCRPWTAKFLADLARAHDAAFHRSIEVSSAVRTVEYQKRLERTNGNAAPAEGDLVSPHLTGATVDIAKKGLSRAEMAWMRRQLMGLEAEGKIDVEEEFKQACFHITVYKSYAPAGKTGPATPAKPVADHNRTAERVEAQGA